jgi:hypothetical protein
MKRRGCFLIFMLGTITGMRLFMNRLKRTNLSISNQTHDDSLFGFRIIALSIEL